MLKILFVCCFVMVSSVQGSNFLDQEFADKFISRNTTQYNSINLNGLQLDNDDLELFCRSSKLQRVVEINFTGQRFLCDDHIQLLADNLSSGNLTKLELEDTKVSKTGLLSLVKSDYTGSTRFLKQYFIPRPNHARMYFQEYNYNTASIPISAIYVNAPLYKYQKEDSTDFWRYPFQISFASENLNVKGIKLLYLNGERPFQLR